jgi:large conductance mechanosensitive channel
MIGEFRSFLQKNNVVALAIGFIMGAAVGKVVTAMVNDLIMPIITFAMPEGDWRKLVFNLGGAKFLFGEFLGTVVDFIIIAFIVFVITKKLIKEPPPPETKVCPACLETVAAKARRCKFCTEVLST